MEALNIFKDPHTKIKDPYHSLAYSCTLTLSNLFFGFTLVYLSAIDFPVIAKIYSIEFDLYFAQGLFQGVLPIGGAVGALSSSYLVSKLSRKHLLYYFNAAAIVLSLISIIPDYRLFFVVRILQGFTAGALASFIPMILRQTSPHQLTNITGSLPNLFIILGVFWVYFFGFLLGLLTDDTTGAQYWRCIFLFPAVLMAIETALIYFKYPYETPKYLAQNHRYEETRELLAQFYKAQHVDEIFKETVEHYGAHHEDPAKKQYHSKTAFIYGVFYAALCPLVGINVILSYCNEIAVQIFPSLKPVIGAIMMFLFFCFSATAIQYVSKYGRKELTLWGTYGIAASLLGITLGYFMSNSSPYLAQIIIFVSLIVYLFMYGMTYAPLMWMWVAQALQPSQIGYAVMANWGGAAFVMILFPIITELLPNQGYIFLFFAAVALVSTVVTNKLMLETRGKKDHEIREDYKKLDGELWTVDNPEGVQMQLIVK